MRILWIGKQPTDGEPGDEVFDRRTIAALGDQGHSVDLFHPIPIGRSREIVNLLSGLPHYRARFESVTNLSEIHLRNGGYDATICSLEAFDGLARALCPPAIMILHNITSRSLPAIFPRNPIAAMAAARARRWERRWYRSKYFAAIATLSIRDRDYVQNLEGRPSVLLLPPGMPPCADLAVDATLSGEIVLSGTFDWIPKHRDILIFARDYVGLPHRLPVRAHALPSEATRLLQPSPMPSARETRAAIRFGLITDRFEAGHKLKTLAYLADNQIVLSFADVGFDFMHIPDHDFFIRRVRSVAGIASHVDAVSSLPAAVIRDRFSRFRQACAKYFTWSAVATTLLEAATRRHEKSRR
jgi:hypothetical protein